MQRPPAPERPFVRYVFRAWPVLAVVAVGALVGIPGAFLAHATSLSRACLTSVREPRTAELPSCATAMSWFVMPSRVPWTATSSPARNRAEELTMRVAIAAYDDASIGRPNAEQLETTGAGLVTASDRIKAGSQRVMLDELGPGVGAPDRGRSAMLAGDRRTLLAHAESWEDWQVRVRTLDAALLEGDVARARTIAQRYLASDPHDEDLRVAIGALLCMGDGDAKPDVDRAVGLFTSVEVPRAHDRHESWVRNWGDIRALVLACSGKARKAGRASPPVPDPGEGGSDDVVEARAVLRLRQARRARDEGGTSELRLVAFEVRQLLRSGPMPPSVRLRVLAALLANDESADPSDIASLATPHASEGEGELSPLSRSFTAVDWLEQPRAARPSPSRHELRRAASRLEQLEASAEISSDEKTALHTAASAMTIEAIRAFALAGDAETATEVLDQSTSRLVANAAARALLRSTAFYVTGDAARAFAAIEHAPSALKDDAGLEVAWWIQRAEILASLGRTEEAARAAVTADDAATLLGDRSLAVRASWTRVAFARSGTHESALRDPAPPPLPGARSWPWTGEMATTASWLAAGPESPAALSRALASWDGARRATPEELRALRYAAIAKHRGDAPRSLAPYLALAAELLPRREGDVEVWLDAFSATTVRRGSLRSYAWARTEAARFRGDRDAAARWAGVYAALVKAAASPADTDLAAALGI